MYYQILMTFLQSQHNPFYKIITLNQQFLVKYIVFKRKYYLNSKIKNALFIRYNVI